MDSTNTTTKPWITAPFHGPVEVTALGEVIPPAGMVPATRLRNDVGPAFMVDPALRDRVA